MNHRCRSSRAIARVVLVGTLCVPLRAPQAGMPVIDASNLAQNVVTAIQQTLSVIEEIRVVSNQVRQLQHELEMLQNMSINTKPAGTVAWGQVKTILSSLSAAIETGLSIPYALTNVGAAFRSRFPGYVAPTDWAAEYESWSTTVLDTLRGTLASAGMNVADAPSVHAALEALRLANDGSEGRLQAIQIGNQIATLQVEELAKLRQLAAAQINAQNAYLGAQEAKQAGSAAAFDLWIGNAPTTIPVSQPTQGFGVVPRP